MKNCNSIKQLDFTLSEKYYILSVFLFLLILTSLSCSNNLNINVPSTEEKLVIESYLYQDDPVMVTMLSTSWSPFIIKYGYDTSSRVNGAEVTIYSNGSSFQLERDTGKYFPNRWYSGSRCGYYVCENNSMLSENARINVKYKGKEYSAVSNFPAKPIIISAAGEIRQDKESAFVAINIGPQQEKKSFYRIKIKVDYTYTSYIYTHNESQEDIEYFFIENSTEPKLMEFENGVNIFSGVKFKKISITLEHINEDYYNFLEVCATQRRKNYSPLGTEGTEVPSSFQDCYGIFTCISRDTVCVNLNQ
jgi:hypothetical protein